ncbi:31164_t:CDS:2, partial [Racocetra persica]
EAHALTARLTHSSPEPLPFPFLTLLISGGHTLTLIAHGIGHYTQLGTTIDDSIEQYASNGDPEKYVVPIPMRKDAKRKNEMNYSFSGLKTSIRDLVEKNKLNLNDERVKNDLAATFQRAAIIHLVDKLELAFEWCRNNGVSLTALVASGGVASNKSIRSTLEQLANERHNIPLICPPPHLCTDNGIMIAWTGVERFRAGLIDEYTIDHIPKWPIANK